MNQDGAPVRRSLHAEECNSAEDDIRRPDMMTRHQIAKHVKTLFCTFQNLCQGHIETSLFGGPWGILLGLCFGSMVFFSSAKAGHRRRNLNELHMFRDDVQRAT